MSIRPKTAQNLRRDAEGWRADAARWRAIGRADKAAECERHAEKYEQLAEAADAAEAAESEAR